MFLMLEIPFLVPLHPFWECSPVHSESSAVLPVADVWIHSSEVLPVSPVDSAVSPGAVNHVSGCVKCTEYTHVAREFPPSSLTSGTLRKLGLQKVFPFRMPEKRFPENKHKSGAQAYALTLR
jgi:hypothetical protein